jgi:hypothetical protein
VEDAEFGRYVQVLCPRYHIPSRKIFRDSLMPIFDQTTVRKVKAKLDAAAGVCWMDSFLTLTANCLGEETNVVIQLTYTHTFCGVKSLPEGQQHVK